MDKNIIDKDIIDLIKTILFLLNDYVKENPNAVMEETFHEVMIENVHTVLLETTTTKEFVNLICEDFFYTQYYPHRSKLRFEPIDGKPYNGYNEKNTVEQRTPEWYLFRHNLITASNAYKIFGSDCQRNSLIVEKCEDIKEFATSSSGSLHHGQKYEPLSVMYYEHIFDTQLGEFGCLKHRDYDFLGASPDGICLKTSRMVEIKNVVSRTITGIPKLEYWVQMQLQMEVYDLDETDFLETKFVEYQTEDEFLTDGNGFLKTATNQWKGIIVQMENGKYNYKPLLMEAEEYQIWLQQFHDVSQILFWKLDVASCVLVPRNRQWFLANIGTMQEFWNIVLKEREEGFKHRLPKPKLFMEKLLF
jgi:putative phage-type endonuclease